MREIKFRAYHKEEKRMYFNVEQTYDYGTKVNNEVMEKCFGDVIDNNDFILMQFIGWEDKNGKEIYAGDILKIFFPDSMYTGVIGRVEYMPFGCVDAAFHLVDRNNNTRILQEDDSDNYEVIGNVYENPELLKEAK